MLATSNASLEEALAIAEKARSASDSTLQSVRLQLVESVTELEDLRKSKEVLQHDLHSTQIHVRKVEDRAREAERHREEVENQALQLKTSIEKETSARIAQEKKAKAIEADEIVLRNTIANHSREAASQRNEVKRLERELHKAIALQDTTIVEHVHVLEEAKRYTDRQLEESQAALRQAHGLITMLEKTKKRLTGELEDLNRTVNQEKTFYNKGQNIENSLVKERQLRESAEAETKRLRKTLVKKEESLSASRTQLSQLGSQKLESTSVVSKFSPINGRPTSISQMARENAQILAEMK